MALQLFSRISIEPWGWFLLLERPRAALAFGLAGGIVAALVGARTGLAPLAPLLLAIPAAAPFIPSGVPFFRAYQAVAVDLAWPLLAVALLGSIFNIFPSWPSGAWADSPKARRIFRLGIPLAFLALSAGAFYTGERIKRGAGFSGDSPQYLLVADALVMDRSANLMPAIMREDYVHWNEEAVGGHGRTYNFTEQYSKYKIGYSAALAPFVAAGWLFAGDFRLWAIFGTALFGAAAAWQVWELLNRDMRLSPQASAMGTASVMFTFPMLSYGSQIYPEMIAALMVTLGLRFLVTAGEAEMAGGVGMGMAMGALLFLHDRFAFFGGPAIFAYFWLTRRRAWAVWPAFIATLAVFAGINIYDLHVRHFPIIPGRGQYGVSGGYWNKEGVYIGWLGGLLDKGHGALAYAPVFALFPAFIVIAARKRPWVAVPVMALFALVYMLALGFEEWWAGTSPPGARYLVAYYPALAVAAGLFWQTRPAAWVYWLFFLLLGTGLVTTHNFYLYAQEDYLVHQCFLDRRLAALDLTRILYDFIHDNDLAAKALAWAMLTGALTAGVIAGRERRIPPTSFALGLGVALFLLVGMFYAAFPEKPQGFAERQRDFFGLPKKGERMFWSANAGIVDAQIPARFLPAVPFKELDDGWVRLAPGVANNGLMVYGGYLKLPPGQYRIEIPLRAPGSGAETGFIEVVDARAGMTILPGKTFPITQGALAQFTLADPMLNVEARLRFDSSVPVEIGPMRIKGRLP